jgi:hypothetical protein
MAVKLAVPYARLAKSLGAYCADSKDCDKETIMSGFVAYLREVIEADGVLDDEELAQLQYLTDLLISEAKSAGAGAVVTDALSNAASGISRGTGYILSTGSQAVIKSKQLLREVSESIAVETVFTKASQVASSAGEVTNTGVKEGKKVALQAGGYAASKANSLWNKLTIKDEEKPV